MCDRHMPIRYSKQQNHFAIKLRSSLYMYMHRNTLVYMYIKSLSLTTFGRTKTKRKAANRQGVSLFALLAGG